MKPVLIRDALDHYYHHHLRPNAVTQRQSETTIKTLKAYFKDGLLRDIGPMECIHYASHRAAQNIMKSTAAKELAVLKAAAKHALKWKLITLPEAPTFEMPKVQRSKGIWLFQDELEALLAAAQKFGETETILPYRTLSFIELAYGTGSRRNAVERLLWPQVSEARRRIDLAQPGEKQTNKRRPTVPMDGMVQNAINRCQRYKINDFVLGAGTNITLRFENVAKAAGLFELSARESRPAAKLTPHMLRHSRATHMLQAGKSPWVVANLLGDNLQTVLAVYGHHCPDYLEMELTK